MQLLDGIQELWLTSFYWWGGFCAAFLVLSRFCPCNPGQNWWTAPRAAITDFVYWLLLPLMSQLGRVALLVAGVMILYGGGATPEFAARGWPLWTQCIVILLLQDVMMYWIHRLFHTRLGWQFHAVHHSPEVVDWTSAKRFHPVNAIGEFVFADAVILLMGFSPMALAILGPINLIYSAMVHANLNWTFGPLRYVFASPVFHRWHHTTEQEGLSRITRDPEDSEGDDEPAGPGAECDEADAEDDAGNRVADFMNPDGEVADGAESDRDRQQNGHVDHEAPPETAAVNKADAMIAIYFVLRK